MTKYHSDVTAQQNDFWKIDVYNNVSLRNDLFIYPLRLKHVIVVKCFLMISGIMKLQKVRKQQLCYKEA